MRAFIRESAGCYAVLKRGARLCPRDAWSSHDRRGMRALITQSAGCYAVLKTWSEALPT